MLCVLGLGALIVWLLRGGGGGGRFSWNDPSGGPLGPSSGSGPSAGTPSSSIVPTRCRTGAAAKCRTCVVHRALGDPRQPALPG